jgi:hypothetical protein
MPVFQETAHAARDLRILPSRALPLPRLSPRPQVNTGTDEKYEVIVIGVWTSTPKSFQPNVGTDMTRLARLACS